MNKFEQWIIKRIIKKEVRQGNHENQIVNLYQLIYNATEKEFTEDNIPTINQFLAECFIRVLK